MSSSQKRDLTSYTLFVIPVALLFFNPSYIDPFNVGKLIPLFSISLALLITILATLSFDRSARRSINVVGRDVFPYLVFFASLVIAGFVATENHWRLFLGIPGRNNGLIYYFTALVFSILILLFRIKKRHEIQISKILVFSGIALIAYSAIQLLGLDPQKWVGSQNPIIGTFGNANFAAAALGSFAVYYIVKNNYQDRAQTVLSLAISSLAAFLSWKTDSIQGPLICFVGIALFGVVAFARRGNNAKSTYFLLSGLGIISVIMFVSFLGLGPLGDRLEQYTLKLRVFYSQIGLQIMSQYPLFGIGTDSYLIGFQQNRTVEFVREYGFNVLTNNAHSVPIQIGANFGLLAFLLYSFIMLKILYFSLSMLFSDKNLTRENQAVIVLWVLLFTQSLFSIEQIGLGVVTWVIGAYILRIYRDKEIIENKNESLRKNHTYFGESLLLLTIFFGLLFGVPYGQEDRARRDLISLQSTSQSISIQDKDFIYSRYSKLTSITLSEATLVTPVLEKLYAVNNIEEIGKISKDLVERNPRDYYAWDHLATYYRIVENPGMVLKTLNKMIALDPINAETILDAAKISQQLGMRDEARTLVLRVLEIDPNSSQATEARRLMEVILEQSK